MFNKVVLKKKNKQVKILLVKILNIFLVYSISYFYPLNGYHVDVVINDKNWVWVASTSFPGLFPSRGGAPREGKSPGNEVGVACGLCVNKMTDARL